MPFPYDLLPCEIRLQILRNLLTHSTFIYTNSSHQLGPLYPTPLSLSPDILLASKRAYADAIHILYGENTFQAHPQYLASSVFAIDPTRLVTAVHCIKLIKRWHVRVRLDCDLYYQPEDLRACFDGCDSLEVEVFRSSWGKGDYEALTGFQRVRGVKRACVHGSVGEAFAKYLETCMMNRSGQEADPWEPPLVDVGYKRKCLAQ